LRRRAAYFKNREQREEELVMACYNGKGLNGLEFLNYYAKEKGIEFRDYHPKLCDNDKNSGIRGASREVTVTAKFSDEQMAIVRKNMRLYPDPQELTKTARDYAINCKEFPDDAEFEVKVEDMGKTELKIIGSSVFTIAAVVDILLPTEQKQTI
jgi:hypothetical protein